jgi:alkanesulfonate monooxygenase SsuD/methylene tetrahydromethanopterin reductase-like flavin-dependent oxidoreductase (luciferase family)
VVAAARLLPMKVGVVLPQSAEDGAGGTWAEIAALARQAEAGGIDSLWVCDHFFFREDDGREVGIHEAWTLLTALAAVTGRVELGTLVLATSFRNPGLLAKMAATADEVAGGRLILGLGCGWYETEYDAFDYPFDHRVGRFEEALKIVVPLIRGERVTVRGQWTSVDDAVLLPPPRRTAMPILVAAKGERMLRLTARHADQWQTAWFGLPDERWTERHDGLLEACRAEGRDPATVELTVGIDVRKPGAPAEEGGRNLALDAGALADGLAVWAAQGVDHVQLGLALHTPETLDVVLEGVRRFRG